MFRWAVVGLMLVCSAWCAGQEAREGQGRGRNGVAAPSVKMGPVRVTAGNATVQRAVVMGHEPRRVNLTTIYLNVAADAGVVVSSLTDLNIETLLDQNGKPLKGAFRMFGPEVRLNNNVGTLAIEMSDLPGDVTDVSKLVCTFNVQVAKPEMIEVTDLRPNHTVTRETSVGDTVSITYKTTADGFTVEMQAELKNQDPKAARDFGSAPLRVVDASGQAYNSSGGSGNSNSGHVGRTMNFRTGHGTINVSVGPPAKVVLAAPTSFSAVPVKVEFKDLAVP